MKLIKYLYLCSYSVDISGEIRYLTYYNKMINNKTLEGSLNIKDNELI